MAVQEDSALHFSCAWTDSRHVHALLLRKKRINDLPVEDKLKQKQEHGSCSEKDTEPGAEKERCRTERVKSRRKPEIAIERGRVLREGLDLHRGTSTFVFQDIRHVFPGFTFSFTSRRTPLHAPADLCNPIHHIVILHVAWLQFPYPYNRYFCINRRYNGPAYCSYKGHPLHSLQLHNKRFCNNLTKPEFIVSLWNTMTRPAGHSSRHFHP